MYFIKGNLYLITHNEAKMTDFSILLSLHALKKQESIKPQISRGLFYLNNYRVISVILGLPLTHCYTLFIFIIELLSYC